MITRSVLTWLTISGGVLTVLCASPGVAAATTSGRSAAPCLRLVTLPGAFAPLLNGRGASRHDDRAAADQPLVFAIRLSEEEPETLPVKILIALPPESCTAAEPFAPPAKKPPFALLPWTRTIPSTRKPSLTSIFGKDSEPETWPATRPITEKPSTDPATISDHASPGHPRRTTDSRRRATGDVAAAAALTQLGTPFSWGGGTPSGPTPGIGRGARTTGFDCSGLTLYAWSKAGVGLGHYTGSQYRQGRRIPVGDLRKGDLVFFGGGTGDPTHVGLYLGGGVMVHASKTGDVVKKTGFLTSPYFRPIYRGAVRPS
jgi:cell wall-associated NlpC family hydrolase